MHAARWHHRLLTHNSRTKPLGCIWFSLANSSHLLNMHKIPLRYDTECSHVDTYHRHIGLCFMWTLLVFAGSAVPWDQVFVQKAVSVICEPTEFLLYPGTACMQWRVCIWCCIDNKWTSQSQSMQAVVPRRCLMHNGNCQGHQAGASLILWCNLPPDWVAQAWMYVVDM